MNIFMLQFQKDKPSKSFSQSAMDQFDLELPSFFDDEESADTNQSSSVR